MENNVLNNPENNKQNCPESNNSNNSQSGQHRVNETKESVRSAIDSVLEVVEKETGTEGSITLSKQILHRLTESTHKERLKGLTKEKVKEFFKSQRSLEGWAIMSEEERERLNLDGYTVEEMVEVMGVRGDPVEDTEVWFQLLAKAHNEEGVEEIDVEKIKELMIKMIKRHLEKSGISPVALAWIQLGGESEINKLRIFGRRLVSVVKMVTGLDITDDYGIDRFIETMYGADSYELAKEELVECFRKGGIDIKETKSITKKDLEELDIPLYLRDFTRVINGYGLRQYVEGELCVDVID